MQLPTIPLLTFTSLLLQQGDVAELFASSGPSMTSSNTTTTTHTAKTWSDVMLALSTINDLLFNRSKSDLTTTIQEITALGKMENTLHDNCDVGILANTVTQQMEAGKTETKALLRGQQVNTTEK